MRIQISANLKKILENPDEYEKLEKALTKRNGSSDDLGIFNINGEKYRLSRIKTLIVPKNN